MSDAPAPFRTDLRGWASKDRSGRRRAHYILDDATAACSHLPLKSGGLRLAPFTCRWIPFQSHHHLCRLCARMFPKKCACGLCTASRPALVKLTNPGSIP